MKTAWFMTHRIREALSDSEGLFAGPIDIEKPIWATKKEQARLQKTECRTWNRWQNRRRRCERPNHKKVKADIADSVDGPTLKNSVSKGVEKGPTVFTDDASACRGLSGVHHKQVKYSAGEYVNDQAQTNGVESFWSTLKRG